MNSLEEFMALQGLLKYLKYLKFLRKALNGFNKSVFSRLRRYEALEGSVRPNAKPCGGFSKGFGGVSERFQGSPGLLLPFSGLLLL